MPQLTLDQLDNAELLGDIRLVRQADADEIEDTDEVDAARERLRRPPYAMTEEEFFDREFRMSVYTDRIDMGFSPFHPDDGKPTKKMLCYSAPKVVLRGGE